MALRTGETVPEQQMDIMDNSNGKGGAIGVRQQCAGNHHYQEN